MVKKTVYIILLISVHYYSYSKMNNELLADIIKNEFVAPDTLKYFLENQEDIDIVCYKQFDFSSFEGKNICKDENIGSYYKVYHVNNNIVKIDQINNNYILSFYFKNNKQYRIYYCFIKTQNDEGWIKGMFIYNKSTKTNYFLNYRRSIHKVKSDNFTSEVDCIVKLDYSLNAISKIQYYYNDRFNIVTNIIYQDKSPKKEKVWLICDNDNLNMSNVTFQELHYYLDEYDAPTLLGTLHYKDWISHDLPYWTDCFKSFK